MSSCGIASIVRHLARVAISSVTFCKWVPYGFELEFLSKFPCPSVLVLQSLSFLH